ncbi:Hok/Gef family protein [Shigella sonnei]|nr:Hok/Gef family protein [Shigella sonnei]
MPQRTFLMMLIVICVTILCFVWMVRDSLCGLRLHEPPRESWRLNFLRKR